MCFMILREGAIIGARFRVLGKQVKSLHCPRNGKRESRSNHVTARKGGKTER